ncbi:hypothetical protein LCGC14_1031960 [marine sediment metagenome]|uniref:Uncharacterized protein n=1 Tax=marine sediment metagenome TaxID=412755 RepID=A0A0F9QCH3_9ZZZZ
MKLKSAINKLMLIIGMKEKHKFKIKITEVELYYKAKNLFKSRIKDKEELKRTCMLVISTARIMNMFPTIPRFMPKRIQTGGIVPGYNNSNNLLAEYKKSRKKISKNLGIAAGKTRNKIIKECTKK